MDGLVWAMSGMPRRSPRKNLRQPTLFEVLKRTPNASKSSTPASKGTPTYKRLVTDGIPLVATQTFDPKRRRTELAQTSSTETKTGETAAETVARLFQPPPQQPPCSSKAVDDNLEDEGEEEIVSGSEEGSSAIAGPSQSASLEPEAVEVEESDLELEGERGLSTTPTPEREEQETPSPVPTQPFMGTPLASLRAWSTALPPRLAALRASETHAVLFKVQGGRPDPTTPYPTSYRDAWDGRHVKLPCSPKVVHLHSVADLGGGGGPWRGGMVSAQYLRGARRGGGIFWPVGQKFWARREMKTYIRHCLHYLAV